MKVPKVRFFNISKRQKFVLLILVLSTCLFLLETFTMYTHVWVISAALGLLTIFLLWLVLRGDMKSTFFYPLLILPFMYSLSFVLFSSLIPSRILSRIVMTLLYAFGLYSLLLSHNIFTVSSTRTINLLRSARAVSFILTILIHFFFMSVIFSLHLILPFQFMAVFLVAFLLHIHSFWSYSLDPKQWREMIGSSIFIALCIAELSVVLLIWPVNATVFAIFLSGIFYTYSGLIHVWLERRLFKGVLWEYVWVGFLSVLLLLFFSRWGI